MRCEEFERNLNVLLDERGNPATDESLQSHASGCDNCQELLQGHVMLTRALSADVNPRPSEGFVDRVISAAVPQKRHKSIADYLMNLAVVAAAILFAVSLIQFEGRPSEPAGSGKLVKKTNSKNGPNSAVQQVSYAARASITETLLVPSAIHLWNHRSKYNQWFNKTMNSVRKLQTPAKKPSAEIPRQTGYYV